MRIITFLLLLTFTGILNLKAQSKGYIPVVQQGAWWFSYSSLHDGFVTIHSGSHFISFNGQITFNNKEYHILRYGFNEDGYIMGYYRQEGHKVYKYHLENQQEYLLYNFALEIGDTILVENLPIGWVSFTPNFEVSDIYYVTLDDGTDIKMLCLKELGSSYEYNCNINSYIYNIAEGIGSFNGGIEMPFGSTIMLGSAFKTKAYGINEEILYGNTSATSLSELIEIEVDINEINHAFITLSPNPATQYLKIQSKIEVAQTTIYGINGQKVLRLNKNNKLDISQLKSGRYIAQIKLVDGSVSSQHFIKQ